MYFKKMLISLFLFGIWNMQAESELPSTKQPNSIEQQLLLERRTTIQKLVDNAIKKNNVEQLKVYLKEGWIDTETMHDSLKKMVEQQKGTKILDAFEEFYTFCKNNKLPIEDTIDPKVLDVVFYWSLAKRKSDTFKHAMEITTEVSQATLNRLIEKIDENCNSSFKNLSNRKKACKEFNALMKHIMDATK